MKLGAFFFGGVELDDAGAGPPAPMDRRASNDQMWKATTDYVSSAVEAERLGYDSFWTTEPSVSVAPCSTTGRPAPEDGSL